MNCANSSGYHRDEKGDKRAREVLIIEVLSQGPKLSICFDLSLLSCHTACSWRPGLDVM